MLPGNFLDRSIRHEKSAASDRGAVGDRVVYAVCARAMRKRRGSPVRYAGLERQEYVEDLLAIAALLHIGNLAAASVRDTRLRDLVVRHIEAVRHLPRPLRRAVGFRAARRCLRTVFAVSLVRDGGEVVARIPHGMPVRATADGGACGFYAAAVAELLRQLVSFDGAVRHLSCRANGDDRCEWRTTAAPPGAG